VDRRPRIRRPQAVDGIRERRLPDRWVRVGAWLVGIVEDADRHDQQSLVSVPE